MAFGAIHNFVSFCQGKEVVFNLICCPVEAGDVVAFCAIGGKTGVFVVGVSGGGKIREVAIDTIISDPLEAQGGFRFMAVGTSGRGMCANERESVILMQLGNIVHQPIFRIVAAGAVISDRSVVHIGVAGNTSGFGVRKNQRFMAGPAIHPNMLPGKGEIGFGVAELGGIPADLPAGGFGKYRTAAVPLVIGYFPTGRRMAVGAIDLELGAVRRLRYQIDCQSQKQYYK